MVDSTGCMEKPDHGPGLYDLWCSEWESRAGGEGGGQGLDVDHAVDEPEVEVVPVGDEEHPAHRPRRVGPELAVERSAVRGPEVHHAALDGGLDAEADGGVEAVVRPLRLARHLGVELARRHLRAPARLVPERGAPELRR